MTRGGGDQGSGIGEERSGTGESGATRNRRAILLLVAVLCLIAGIKASTSTSIDIHVYLHAASQFAGGQDIYSNNPHNRYLYSPLFAMLMQPLAAIDWSWARFLWLIVNGLAGIRVWILFQRLAGPWLPAPGRGRWLLAAGIAILSLEFLNQNLNLGQITLLILWLTVEGCLLVLGGRPIPGAALLALGVNIKIVPVLALVYLLIRRAWMGAGLTMVFLVVSLMLPAVQAGWTRNVELHERWIASINPGQSDYVFEQDKGCQSLNCTLSAYLLDPEAPENVGYHPAWARMKAAAVLPLIRAGQVALILALLIPIVQHRRRRAPDGLQTFREIACLLVISLLLFPHQMAYATLYAVPAAAYVFLYGQVIRVSGNAWRIYEGLLIGASLCLAALVAVQGRDLIGNAAVNLFRFYRLLGLSAIVWMVALIVCRPERLTVARSGDLPAGTAQKSIRSVIS